MTEACNENWKLRAACTPWNVVPHDETVARLTADVCVYVSNYANAAGHRTWRIEVDGPSRFVTEPAPLEAIELRAARIEALWAARRLFVSVVDALP